MSRFRDFLPAEGADDQQTIAGKSTKPGLEFEPPWDRRILASFLGLSVSGLDKLIASGKAPPGFRAGRLLRWRPDVVRRPASPAT